MPRACLRNVGPQSKMPYRTEYTKKLASDNSQIYRFVNTSRRNVLATGSTSALECCVPSTGGKPIDSGVSRSTIASHTAPNSTIPAGTKKHSRQSMGAR